MTTKGILYYSDSTLPTAMATTCQRFMAESGLPITSVTLKPVDFGRNIVLDLPRSYKAMYQQILTGLESMTEDVVFFGEHDVLYALDHFAFTPPDDQTYCYNGNYWFLRMSDGLALHYDVAPLSGLVAYRKPLLIHFRERCAYIAKRGFGYFIGFEPMVRNRVDWSAKFPWAKFQPACPNVDLCHGQNLSKKRWDQRQFIRKPEFWDVSDIDNVPGWLNLREIVADFFPIPEGTLPNGYIRTSPQTGKES